jgi:hypothetical protein
MVGPRHRHRVARLRGRSPLGSVTVLGDISEDRRVDENIRISAKRRRRREATTSSKISATTTLWTLVCRRRPFRRVDFATDSKGRGQILFLNKFPSLSASMPSPSGIGGGKLRESRRKQ